jgi:formate hydrogenlyase subunit 3/multisubunit Na+/H+ antiporter MnhD subunit
MKLLLLDTLLLYSGAGTTPIGVIAALIIIVALAIVGFVGLVRVGFKSLDLKEESKENSKAIPLILVAIGITVGICLLLASNRADQ